jgi:hypothetical protein
MLAFWIWIRHTDLRISGSGSVRNTYGFGTILYISDSPLFPTCVSSEFRYFVIALKIIAIIRVFQTKKVLSSKIIEKLQYGVSHTSSESHTPVDEKSWKRSE